MQIVLFLTGMLCLNLSVWSQTTTAIDSAFWHLSLPELQNYKVYYLQELDRLQELKQNLIRRGIEDGERLLETQNTGSVDEILIRLADLYYLQSKDDYFQLMEAYDIELQKVADKERTILPEEPQYDFSRSLALYQRLIDEFPQSELVDDAVYNQAFLYEESGQHQKANQLYLHFIESYPESNYVPEAYMRLGEYYFNPPQNDLEKAIEYYEKVLAYKESERYHFALYKIGWSYYRLSEYPQAISYFTALVKDVEMTYDLDPLGFGTHTHFKDEALEYIAICFMEFGAAGRARDYLRGLGDPDWGWDVLKILGDKTMREREEYAEAVDAYRVLLEYEPYSAQSPAVQKLIADCFFLMNNDRDAFIERQRLFENYRKDSVWWQNQKDEKAKLDAFRLTEQALRENIMNQIQWARQEASIDLDRQTVSMGRLYLESFPENLYAYMIRWNIALILDAQLHQYKEALQEYLTITMVYNTRKYEQFARQKGLAGIRDAAENAIVVADSLVRQEARTLGAQPRQTVSANLRKPVPLSTAESWLAMAYDIYIQLFPFDPNTPFVLASAGYLYYSRNQFAEALKYFKTLVRYFPDSRQIKEIQFSILESYVGKGDYDSAELMAKQILREQKLTDADRKTAQERLAEAIFYRAQSLAETNNDSLSAKEFYRLVLEVPQSVYADRALFNAGQGYDKIGAYPFAIRAYELLRVSYAGSPLFPDALNNLAFDYGETGEYAKGAQRYEELYNLLPKTDQAKDALYNAYLLWDKAGDAERACETGLRYADQFPEAEESPLIYLRTGEYYVGLNRLDQARQVFTGFIQRFPHLPQCVEAYYRLGILENGLGNTAEANHWFQEAVAYSQELNRRGTKADDYYTAEALFSYTQNLHKQYRDLKFRLPINYLNEHVRLKQDMMNRLVEHYTRVAAYGTHRLPESVYRIGEVYEEFAMTWAGQEMPILDATSRAAKQREINNRTTQVLGQAYSAFRKAIQALDRLQAGTSAEESAGNVSEGKDSLIVLKRHWQELSKIKVSKVLYQMAEVNSRTVEGLMTAPVPADMNDAARLEYRSQLLLRGVKPLLDVAVEAHRRNLLVGDSLNISNEWIQASRSKILTSLTHMGREYGSLSFDALENYRSMVRLCKWTIFDQGEPLTMESINEMVNFIELAKGYLQGSIAFQKNGVLKAYELQLPVDQVVSLQESFMRYVFRLADSLDVMLENNIKDQSSALRRFDETGALIYEDLLAALEDNAYYLKENRKVLLENAYETENAFREKTPGAIWLAVRLVRLDPDKYTRQFRIPVKEIVIKPDTTWCYSLFWQDNWLDNDLSMSGWRNPPKPADSLSNRTEYRLGIALQNASDTLFVRKDIQIPGYAVGAEIRFLNDSPGKLFVNGRPVNEEQEKRFVFDELEVGRNILAMQFWGKTRLSIYGEGRIRYVPLEAKIRKGGGIP